MRANAVWVVRRGSVGPTSDDRRRRRVARRAGGQARAARAASSAQSKGKTGGVAVLEARAKLEELRAETWADRHEEERAQIVA
eukprot:2841443-Rhodomonas_salina.1